MKKLLLGYRKFIVNPIVQKKVLSIYYEKNKNFLTFIPRIAQKKKVF